MPDIKLQDGTKLSFQNDPTPADVDFAIQQLKGGNKPSFMEQVGTNLKSAYNESFGAGMSAINDLSANNIKPNVARVAGQDTANAIFPEQNTLEGKATRFATGFALPAGKAIEAMGALKGGALIGAGYGGLQDIANPNTTIPQRETGAVEGAGLGLATAGAVKAAPTIISKALDLVPQPIKDRIFNLYNTAIGAKIKNISDAANIKDSRINMVKTISDNLPNVQFTSPAAQEAGVPLNRADNLEAFQQTKDAIWQKHLSDTQGASDASVKVNYPSVVSDALADIKAKIGNKSLGLDSNGKPIPGANTGLIDAFNKIADEQKALGQMSPSEAINHLKYLNDQIKPLYNSGNATDFSTKDLLSSIRYKLSEATDSAIEDNLGKSGFSQQRKQFSDVRAAEKEVVGSANKYYREIGGQGGGVTHPIVDLWTLKDLLQSGAHAITGNPVGAVANLGQAAAVKTASKLADFMKSPDRRISQMYKLASQYSPTIPVKAELVRPTLALPDKTWMNDNPNTNIRPLPQTPNGQAVSTNTIPMGTDIKTGIDVNAMQSAKLKQYKLQLQKFNDLQEQRRGALLQKQMDKIKKNPPLR